MIKKRKFWANLSVSRPLRNDQGFTLMELVITIALMGILMLGAVTVFMTASNAFTMTQVRNRQQLLLDGMMESIATELRYATEVNLSGTGSNRIYTDGADLYLTTVSTTREALSGEGYDLSLNFKREDDYILLLEITLTDPHQDITTRESTSIRLINCERTATPLNASLDTGTTVAYTEDLVSLE